MSLPLSNAGVGAHRSSPLQRADARMRMEECLARLSPAQVQEHQDYYNRTVACIDGLRQARFGDLDRLLPPSPEVQAVDRATRPRAGDTPEQAELRAEYQRAYRSLRRELARASNQREALGPGEHRMGGAVRVQVSGPEVTTIRPDGQWRCTHLDRQSVRMGGPGTGAERLRKEGTRVYRDDRHGWQRLGLDAQGQLEHSRIPRSFRLRIGTGESVQVHCRPRGVGPGERFEVEFRGRHRKSLRGQLEVCLGSDLASPQKALKAALRRRIKGLVSEPDSPVRSSQTRSRTPQSDSPRAPWPRLEPVMVTPAAAHPSWVAAPRKASPKTSQALPSHSAPKPVRSKPARPKALKGKPPRRLSTGVKVVAPAGRLRKARKSAARRARYQAYKGRPRPAPPRVKEQTARRLASLPPEQRRTLDGSKLKIVVHQQPPGQRPFEYSEGCLRVPEELLYQPWLSHAPAPRDALLQGLGHALADQLVGGFSPADSGQLLALYQAYKKRVQESPELAWSQQALDQPLDYCGEGIAFYRESGSTRRHLKRLDPSLYAWIGQLLGR